MFFFFHEQAVTEHSGFAFLAYDTCNSESHVFFFLFCPGARAASGAESYRERPRRTLFPLPSLPVITSEPGRYFPSFFLSGYVVVGLSFRVFFFGPLLAGFAVGSGLLGVVDAAADHTDAYFLAGTSKIAFWHGPSISDIFLPFHGRQERFCFFLSPWATCPLFRRQRS